jgi:3-deoxy-7-phosphoheptulonate synthase
MIIVMRNDPDPEEIARLTDRLRSRGVSLHWSSFMGRSLIVAPGDEGVVRACLADAKNAIERTISVAHPFQLASRQVKDDDTIVKVGDVSVGGNEITVIAGPCAVESREQLFETAELVKKIGGNILRGGAFKPRTSPYSFQGLGERALEILSEARDWIGMPTVTEVMAPDQVKMVARYVDALQIGARNMQNFSLLKAVGDAQKPVLLKRGLSATIDEWLLSAEYILSTGNSRVILCERGIRTFENSTRNTLDISSVPMVKRLSHLPVIVDPSHATGMRDLVIPIARAAVAAGADGVMVEVHANPEKALCDGAQSLDAEGFELLMDQLRVIATAMNRRVEQG